MLRRARAWLGRLVRARRGPPPDRQADAEGSAARARVFCRIHAANEWGTVESRSGPGSTLARTEHLREGLPRLLDELGVRSLLDAPCGDFHWMQHVVPHLDRYVGVDIVPEL